MGLYQSTGSAAPRISSALLLRQASRLTYGNRLWSENWISISSSVFRRARSDVWR